MAAVTPTLEIKPTPDSRHVYRYSGAGTANTDATLTTTVKHGVKRLVYAYVSYSGAVTQTGVTVAIDSGLGSGYDITLHTGSANAQFTIYSPDEEVWLMPDDAVAVTALAGGAGDVASIVVVLEGK